MPDRQIILISETGIWHYENAHVEPTADGMKLHSDDGPPRFYARPTNIGLSSTEPNGLTK